MKTYTVKINNSEKLISRLVHFKGGWTDAEIVNWFETNRWEPDVCARKKQEALARALKGMTSEEGERLIWEEVDGALPPNEDDLAHYLRFVEHMRTAMPNNELTEEIYDKVVDRIMGRRGKRVVHGMNGKLKRLVVMLPIHTIRESELEKNREVWVWDTSANWEEEGEVA